MTRDHAVTYLQLLERSQTTFEGPRMCRSLAIDDVVYLPFMLYCRPTFS